MMTLESWFVLTVERRHSCYWASPVRPWPGWRCTVGIRGRNSGWRDAGASWWRRCVTRGPVGTVGQRGQPGQEILNRRPSIRGLGGGPRRLGHGIAPAEHALVTGEEASLEPAMIAVPNLAGAPNDREASVSGLTQRYAAIWTLADNGGSPEVIARATGQPRGQIDLILGLQRQVDANRTTDTPCAPHLIPRRNIWIPRHALPGANPLGCAQRADRRGIDDRGFRLAAPDAQGAAGPQPAGSLHDRFMLLLIVWGRLTSYLSRRLLGRRPCYAIRAGASRCSSGRTFCRPRITALAAPAGTSLRLAHRPPAGCHRFGSCRLHWVCCHFPAN